MQSTNINKKSKIGVGLAGLGFGEKVHLPGLFSSQDLEPIALWHPRPDRLNDACKTHDLKGYDNWSALLNNADIDAVIIATPPEPRFKLAYDALQAGKHLLLEKPVALNSEEILELQSLSIKKKLSVAVDFEYRAVPLFMQAKQMIDDDLIGTPWLIKLDWLMSSRADESRAWNWYSEKQSGGGVIGALGTHAFDLLHWFFGPTKNINGLTSTSIQKRPSIKSKKLENVTSEDICLAQLELSNFKSQQPIPAQVTLSAVSRYGRGFWLEIYGNKGTLILGSDNQKDYVHGFGLWFGEKGKKVCPITPVSNLAFDRTWEDGRIAPVARIQNWWAESINKGNPVIPGLTEGLLSQRVCEKVDQSYKSGMRLTI
ncbi:MULTISPECIES: Gfo/Idh/MocA family protein [Prochlorococcus]|uniref:Predicted dehydrogenase n=1 Tax=Prochlorococcus marinus (strain SARG / CCMP1375 / SS120) TaxID=167539 RepID=Q7VC85_PROMA|nr:MULTISPECIES: Gfo/Idh/MocA family oxidoreductase [Prochlorococcus]AAP99901.1 Predicted dehydrogenase [Prochlorococcus marinus subsp. marinus str. CCMP1375]KGG11751.1 Oxidoreductase [Prochlorococcus marinus str. LG]KGG18835.1 Oxidoreductase [Prochlorococcus marinus str. SS2]KGG23627.1 Oxidoreductase [Prochlorococcus marinus str. SS35]KGG32137.1 Oxidoreductase [Prochlorococcus marinus str. SS51]